MVTDDTSTSDTGRADAHRAPGVPMAPLPDHRNVHTDWWQELWRRHAHITTPLRQRGLECDIEFALSSSVVRVPLADGSYLIIGPPQESTADRPPGDPEGWTVTRQRQYADTDELFEVIYDSAPTAYSGAPERPETRHGGSATPLIEAIDQHLTPLGLLPGLPVPAQTPLASAGPTPPLPSPPELHSDTGGSSAYVYGDALLSLTDQLNGSESYADAADLLHQILEPTHGLVERLGDFFEAAGEKAKDAEQDDGLDLSYDLADAAAQVRELGELLHVAEDRMRTLTSQPAPVLSRTPRGPRLSSPDLPPAPKTLRAHHR
ncbi:hypothetical protein ACIQ7D_10185 [Streptomyces sp. NPDC096310]|uniref:hypothetical protein n=1 Tax=Streptomyces sp. NPDC096310 TaxID=3366082 RepID=UPI0037F7D044